MEENSKVITLLQNIDAKLGFIIGESIRAKSSKVTEQVKCARLVTEDYKQIAQILGIGASHASSILSKSNGGKK